MKTTRRLLVASAVLLAVVGCSDNEPKADLRGPGPQVGQVFRNKVKFEMKDADRTVQSDGKTESSKYSLAGVSEEEVKVLALDGGKVSKYQTKHIKDETKTEETVGGNTTTDEDVDDLAGAVVLSEKHDGKWTHSLVDAAPTDKQKKALHDLDGWDDEDYIPQGKQPIGRSWEVDATHLKKIMGGGLKSLSGTGKSSFVRLEKYDGELCAVVESDMHVKGAPDTSVGDGLMEMDLKSVEYRSLRLGHAIKATLDGTMRMIIKAKVGDVETSVEIKGKVSGEVETTEQKE